MSGKTLEERITILEDIEEIKKIKAKYCYYQDQKRSQEFMDLFTEDSELDYRPLLQEKMVGKAAFAPLFAKENMVKWERMACHHLANAIVEVNGNRASGVWYMWGVATLIGPKKDIAIVEQLTYEDEFVKENGKWKISKIRGTTAFISPYEDGWIKTPIFDLQSAVSD
jgi:hypothetical protein